MDRKGYGSFDPAPAVLDKNGGGVGAGPAGGSKQFSGGGIQGNSGREAVGRDPNPGVLRPAGDQVEVVAGADGGVTGDSSGSGWNHAGGPGTVHPNRQDQGVCAHLLIGWVGRPGAVGIVGHYGNFESARRGRGPCYGVSRPLQARRQSRDGVTGGKV